jgi:hypothetical protein
VPVAAEYPPRNILVCLRWLQRAQAAGAHLDHFVLTPPAGLLDQDTQAHQEPSRSCRSHASRCPVMPPVISTSGGAHGGCSPAMTPVCETAFDMRRRHHDQDRPICGRSCPTASGWAGR